MNTRSAAWRTITSWPARESATDQAESTSVDAQSDDDEWTRWAGAVNRMAGGDYAGAWPCLTELATVDNTEVAGLASAARASGLRQLGAHTEAVGHDDRAISASGVAVLDGLIGRAADEIGLGNPDRCQHYLERAERMLATIPEQQLRGTTRIGWVTAEAALMTGDSAVAPAHRAVAAANRMGSPRHILKSRLIEGVAMRAIGDTAGDIELLAVLRGSDDLRIRTLVWPAALALEDRLPADLRIPAAAAVAHIRTHLPPGRFDSWLAATDRLDEEPGSRGIS